MNEQRTERLPDFAERILRSLGEVSPGFRARDGSLPEENRCFQINQDLSLINGWTFYLEEGKRSQFLGRGINKLRRLYPNQEAHLRAKVQELVKYQDWITEEQVPEWVFDEVCNE
jgi:hypothetical protein